MALKGDDCCWLGMEIVLAHLRPEHMSKECYQALRAAHPECRRLVDIHRSSLSLTLVEEDACPSCPGPSSAETAQLVSRLTGLKKLEVQSSLGSAATPAKLTHLLEAFQPNAANISHLRLTSCPDVPMWSTGEDEDEGDDEDEDEDVPLWNFGAVHTAQPTTQLTSQLLQGVAKNLTGLKVSRTCQGTHHAHCTQLMHSCTQ